MIVYNTPMLTIINIHVMNKNINSAAVGALVREARLSAGLSQTDLGQRIGASRFWVAQFEKGKPSAELGLALKAMQAVGLTVLIEPAHTSQRDALGKALPSTTDLPSIIANGMLASAAPSSVVGWPTASAAPRRSRKP